MRTDLKHNLAASITHKIQPQFRVVWAPVLRCCNAIELGDGQQSHLQRFQRAMHINVYIRRQCQRYVFPGMRKICQSAPDYLGTQVATDKSACSSVTSILFMKSAPTV